MTCTFNERVGLSVSSLARCNILESLNEIWSMGFRSTMVMPYDKRAKHSLGHFATLNFYDISDKERKLLKECLSKFSHVSLHQSWDSDWRRWLECASYIGAEVVTIHSSLVPRSQAVKLFREIGTCARALGLKVGIENDGDSVLNYLSLIKRVNHPLVGATLDVGHCAFFQEVLAVKNLSRRKRILNNVICNLIKKLGLKLFLLHVHNVDPFKWIDHRSLPRGAINFHAVIKALVEIEYEGFFIIELEEPDSREKALESGKFLTELLSNI